MNQDLGRVNGKPSANELPGTSMRLFDGLGKLGEKDFELAGASRIASRSGSISSVTRSVQRTDLALRRQASAAEV